MACSTRQLFGVPETACGRPQGAHNCSYRPPERAKSLINDVQKQAGRNLERDVRAMPGYVLVNSLAEHPDCGPANDHGAHSPPPIVTITLPRSVMSAHSTVGALNRLSLTPRASAMPSKCDLRDAMRLSVSLFL